MTPEMFERLIKILSEPDIKGYIIQIFAAALPICYAMWISKKDNKVLDDRQIKLEDKQKLIAENILKLTEQQAKLSETQEKVEENLRELTELAQQSRRSNLIKFQNDFPIFFRALDDFEWEYSTLSKSVSDFNAKKRISSDIEDEVDEIFAAIEDLIEVEINYLDNVDVPPLALGCFNKLLRAINSSSKYISENFDEDQCVSFISNEFSRIKIAREELRMFFCM
ncbi:Uncharacterised protein [Streptococcus constellatus]|uniref:Uncharacterized protein n=1 Tax=Streptococcus constellatus TaxID=76860 RepID=A0A564T6T9_STRCV|nr:DUF1090 domain-containing protein [Streptococcus constellatus]VUX02996.1 Uncharacterised protein [Streptococcus constellatus]VUX14019.1 Uncharacterised protein [Streptococcus gordonii]